MYLVLGQLITTVSESRSMFCLPTPPAYRGTAPTCRLVFLRFVLSRRNENRGVVVESKNNGRFEDTASLSGRHRAPSHAKYSAHGKFNVAAMCN